MLKIGIESTAYCEYADCINDFKAGMQKLKEDGYDCVDYQSLAGPGHFFHVAEEAEALAVARKVAEEAKEVGVEIYQAHGLWPTDDTTEEKRLANIQAYIREIKVCAAMGCKRLIVHPCMPGGWGASTEDMFDLNIRMVKELLPYLHEYDVILCVENMPFRNNKGTSVETIREIIDTINDPYCKACLDTGHANLFKNDIYTDVKIFGKDLECLHVHDNGGGWEDRHYIPYQGNIDWEGFFKALSEVGYKGCFSFETVINKNMPEPYREQFRKALAGLARHMANQVK